MLAFTDDIFAMLAFNEERFVIDAVLKLAVKKEALLPDKLYILAFVEERFVMLAFTEDIFAMLAIVEERFIDAVSKLAAKKRCIIT